MPDQMNDDEYAAMFARPAEPRMSDEDEALFRSLYPTDSLPSPVADGLTAEQAADFLHLFGDETVMGEPAVVELLERTSTDATDHQRDEAA